MVFRFGWQWRWTDNKGSYASVWFRRPFPLCWRFRSDEEAIRILCEQVDEILDGKYRNQQLLNQRQQALKEREEVLREIETDL